jgi:adenylate kinase
MLNLVIFGAPGAGKGTQAKLLAERYGLHHLSTGEIFRAEIAAGTELGRQAKVIETGGLVPDDVVLEIIHKYLKDEKDKNGFIFDGFPRTLIQAESFTSLLSEENLKLDAALFLEAPEEELIKRLILRGQTSGRSDDNEAVIKQRLINYHDLTSPVAEYYKHRGLFTSINGVGDIKTIFNDLCAVIDKL